MKLLLLLRNIEAFKFCCNDIWRAFRLEGWAVVVPQAQGQIVVVGSQIQSLRHLACPLHRLVLVEGREPRTDACHGVVDGTVAQPLDLLSNPCHHFLGASFILCFHLIVQLCHVR
eukprot:Lithocolla_globosa_v1_NODE_357_length_4326_cov_202.120815.p4 type:complete len:115 gc:universal NODE_357_length_4326_cov_202.120815:1363-1019(-)